MDEAALDRELELGDRAGAAGDRGDVGDGVQAEVAALDLGDLDPDDDRGRGRDGDVGVDEKNRGAAADAAAEEVDRAPGDERPLFGEGDLDLALPGADDRVRTGLLRGRRWSALRARPRCRRAGPWR